MKEAKGFLVDGFLQLFLGRALSGHVSDSSRRYIVLREGVHESLAHLRRLGQLCRRRRIFWVLQRSQKPLKLRQQKSNAVLELQQVAIGALICSVCAELTREIRLAEDGALAVFTHANIDSDFIAILL